MKGRSRNNCPALLDDRYLDIRAGSRHVTGSDMHIALFIGLFYQCFLWLNPFLCLCHSHRCTEIYSASLKKSPLLTVRCFLKKRTRTDMSPPSLVVTPSNLLISFCQRESWPLMILEGWSWTQNWAEIMHFYFPCFFPHVLEEKH